MDDLTGQVGDQIIEEGKKVGKSVTEGLTSVVTNIPGQVLDKSQSKKEEEEKKIEKLKRRKQLVAARKAAQIAAQLKAVQTERSPQATEQKLPTIPQLKRETLSPLPVRKTQPETGVGVKGG